MADRYPGTVPFRVHRIADAITLWCDLPALTLATAGSEWTETRVAEHFAFGIPGSRSFGDVVFDEQESRIADAERYGGLGSGSHGGGTRVGNLGNFQLKGIGRNPLAGPSVGTWNGEYHGFGGLTLVDAICETVNSLVFGRLLPLGTAACYGLVLSGETTAFYPLRSDAEPSAGAILVRERCIRPAHFLRCAYYTTPPEITLTAGSDVGRTRSAIKALDAECGGQRGFIAFLGEFLLRCATQFAFARLWRINHGSVSAANLSTDGRWLDLVGTSFMEPDMNFTPSSKVRPFTSEWRAVESIISEWVDTYAKYCRTNLSAEPLVAYYREQFEASLIYHLPSFFGIDPPEVGLFEESDGAQVLLREVMAALGGELRLTDAYPQCANPGADPAIQLAERLFANILDTSKTATPVEEAFRSLFESAFNGRKHRSATREAFAVHLAIRCLRRLCFSSFFFRGRLMGQASAVVLGGDRTQPRALIDEWRAMADWTFASGDTIEQTVFRLDDLHLYSCADGSIALDDGGSITLFAGLKGLRQLREVIASLPSARMMSKNYDAFPPVATYDFRPRVMRIVCVLETLSER